MWFLQKKMASVAILRFLTKLFNYVIVERGGEYIKNKAQGLVPRDLINFCTKVYELMLLQWVQRLL